MTEATQNCPECGVPEGAEHLASCILVREADASNAKQRERQAARKCDDLGFFYDLALACLADEPCCSERSILKLRGDLLEFVEEWISEANKAVKRGRK